jgi:Ca2+-transporting ATPase
MEARNLIKDDDLRITWHTLSAEETLKRLATLPQEGLSSEEAARRLQTFGPNRLTEKPRPGFLQLLLNQFNNFIVILLIAAALISAFLGEWVEAGAIFAIVLLNAVLGIIQESRAEQALATLKKLAAPEAQVIRDGRRQNIPAEELVPGDIVILEAGNFVPADVRLLEAVNLRVEEAALTGESLAVAKNAALVLTEDVPLGDRRNTAFMGTTVTYGRGRGVVISTGMRTQLGMIADLLQSMEEESTPLQQRLDNLGRTLGWGALVICALVFIVGLIRTAEISLQAVAGMFMIAVSLAIAAVPEGLPAVVTITLAMGMREMVRRHALIRRLASVETLGSATVICSDKTGTLTQNEMTVTRIWAGGHFFEVSGSGYDLEGDFLLEGRKVTPQDYPPLIRTLWLGTLNNDAVLEQHSQNGNQANCRIIGDPTEGSILIAAAKAGLLAAQLDEAFPRANEIPFDSARKRMVTLHSISDHKGAELLPGSSQPAEGYLIAVKGAPDVVLELCSALPDRQDGISSRWTRQPPAGAFSQANDAMTRDALRVLGLAYRLTPVKPAEMCERRAGKRADFRRHGRDD